MTEGSEAAPTGDDLYKTLVRLVSGGIGEGVDRLMALSTSLDEADVDPDGVVASPVRADPTLMAAVGWMSELPEFARAASDVTYRMSYPAARIMGVAYETAAFVAETTGVAPFIADLTAPARTAWTEERERLTAVGAGEYTRGRVLAVQAFEDSVEGIVGLLSESEELGELVREQTIGVTGAAVQEIRETGAAADGLTEGIFRKLLRRPDRTVPPRPSAEAS